jgi:hypothetical protein
VLTDYTGAGTRLALDAALKLPRGWAYQPKVDGTYCRVTTDERGRIMSGLSRTGAAMQLGDLVGIVAGPPLAVLHGELEAHTEAGVRIAATRGWRNLHLFDCTRSGGASLERLPYAERYAALHRAQVAIELAGLGRIAPMQPDPRRWKWRRPADGGLAPAEYEWRPLNPRGVVPGGPPRDLRRVPVVPMVRTHAQAEELWADFVLRGGGEGIVAVALAAPAGRRGSKRKVKQTDTIEAVVLRNQGGGVVALRRGDQEFLVSARGKVQPQPGQVVEVAHDGFYERDFTPRFARMVRVRNDLHPPVALM